VTQEHWDAKYAGSDFLWSAEPNRFLIAETESLAPGRALDLACGEGRHAVWLAQRGWQVTAVDFSTVALDKAERLAQSRNVDVEWIAADLLEYEPDGPFDFVVVLYLQLPAEERRLVLGRAADALGRGGTLLVCGHDLTNLTEGHGGPSRAEVLFTPDDIVEELPTLTVERAERVVRDGAIDALVRATRPDDSSVPA
jgi:SAM-dependent methyltransferase